MDDGTRALLFSLLLRERTAHLGTLRRGAPLVSMVPYLAELRTPVFLVHVSRLAWHTQDMAADARVSLSIAARDDGDGDPYALPRVSILGEALEMDHADAAFRQAKAAWLARHPSAAVNFELADFRFWRIVPREARFVAGFGRIHNLSAADLRA